MLKIDHTNCFFALRGWGRLRKNFLLNEFFVYLLFFIVAFVQITQNDILDQTFDLIFYEIVRFFVDFVILCWRRTAS